MRSDWLREILQFIGAWSDGRSSLWCIVQLYIRGMQPGVARHESSSETHLCFCLKVSAASKLHVSCFNPFKRTRKGASMLVMLFALEFGVRMGSGDAVYSACAASCLFAMNGVLSLPKRAFKSPITMYISSWICKRLTSSLKDSRE